MSDTFKNEFEDLGNHCSFQSCNRLDFLPIKCDLCRAVFCKEHYSITSHNCAKYDQPKEKEQVTFQKLINVYQCSLDNCQVKEAIEFQCEFCQLNFCMKHRLQIDHVCCKLPKPSGDSDKKAANKEFKFELKQNVSEKNAGIQAKLILMKLKKAAVGPAGLPEESKYYCFVIYLEAKKEYFFSIKWPIGRCIDFLFDKLSINKSNLTKLKLWMNETQIDSSLTVEEFIKLNSVNQGAVLVLK